MDYRQFPAFRDLSPEQFRSFFATGQYGKVPAQRRLIRQGIPGTALFFLTDGRVRVHLDTPTGDRELNVIPAPTVLGEISFFSGEASSAHVTTATEVTALVVRFQVLRQRICAGDAAAGIVMLHLASALGDRAAAMTQKVSEFYGRDSEIRSSAKNLFGEWSFI